MLKPLLEKEVQRMVVTFYKMCGIKVYNLSQGYRPGGKRHATTRQTKGLGDLYCLWPSQGICFWHETKRDGGKQSDEQVDFQKQNAACGVQVVVGGLREATEYVERIRNIHSDPWPSVRRPESGNQ